MPAATIAPSGSRTSGGTQATQQPDQPAQQQAVVPFVRASQEHTEGTFADVSRQQSTGNQDLGPFEVAAYGFARHVRMRVQTTIADDGDGGRHVRMRVQTTIAIVGAGMTVAEDAPFSAVANLALTEPNGDVLIQFTSGYSLFLANKYGGYKFATDPRAKPS